MDKGELKPGRYVLAETFLVTVTRKGDRTYLKGLCSNGEILVFEIMDNGRKVILLDRGRRLGPYSISRL